jgi:hypothetical protein
MKFNGIGMIALATVLAGVNLAISQERVKPAVAAPAATKPYVAVTISKQTTLITAPLRKDGYVNYVAAMNRRLSEGVTPENNAAVPFLKAMGPGEIGEKYRDEYFQLLGISPLAEKGDYYVGIGSYAKATKEAGRHATEEEEKKPDFFEDQRAVAMKRPWTKKEFPFLADWLAANQRPLELIVEASKRPRRFDPLVPEDGTMIGALLPMISIHREAARALMTRAMFRAGEGKLDEAWEDLLACHRLARLIGQGGTLIDALVAIAVDGIACGGDQGLLQTRQLTPAQIARIRSDLDQLPPMPKMADKINVTERFMFLDCVGMMARGGLSNMAALSGMFGNENARNKSLLATLADSAARHAIDWDKVLHIGNSWYDRMTDAMGRTTHAQREAALDKIDHDLKKLSGDSRDWPSLGVSMLSGPRAAVSERIGNIFVALLLPAVGSCAAAEDRATMQFELDRLAFALAAFHANQGSYPEKLADLVPKYVARVPADILNHGANLHYRREGAGFLLYSVGRNGKDDGGKGYDDRKEGEDWDDIVVRVR